MIDDRQLLRLSRNLVRAMFVALGIWSVLEAPPFVTYFVQTMGFGPGVGFEWSYLVTSAIYFAAGIGLIFRSNWLARKLLRPAPADTCPGCDYPIDAKSAICPECGLTLHQISVGQASGLSEED